MSADARQIPPSSLHDTCSLSTHSISQNENSGIRIQLPPLLHDTWSLSIHSMSHNVSGYMLNDTRQITPPSPIIYVQDITQDTCSTFTSWNTFTVHHSASHNVNSGYMFADTRQIPPPSLHYTCSLSIPRHAMSPKFELRIHICWYQTNISTFTSRSMWTQDT